MVLAEGSKDTSFFYKISLGEKDQIKNGRLQVKVFSNAEAAQLALVEYLECLTTQNKPPRLTNEDYVAGDLAFGREYNGILNMAFTRNNILVIVHAPKEKAKVISKEIDTKIQDAPEWNKGTSKLLFIMPE